MLIYSGEHHEVFVLIHDRLGGRVEESDLLKEGTDVLVPNEEPLEREVEHRRSYHYDPETYRQWCPKGLTRS